MKEKIPTITLRIVFRLAIALGVIAVITGQVDARSREQSPYPPPYPPPWGTPTPGTAAPTSVPSTPVVTSTPPPVVPQCLAQAMEYISQEHGIPVEQLIAGAYIWVENGEWFSDWKEDWIDFPSLHKRACVTTVVVKGGDKDYRVALDEKGQVVNLEELRELDEQAYQSRCGKFDAALCDRLPALGDKDLVEVAIWLEDVDQGAIYDTVAANYSSGLQQHPGWPFDPRHPDYERALREAEALFKQAYLERQKPMIDFLQGQGYAADYGSPISPVAYARLPRHVIAVLADRTDVVGIYLLAGELHPRLKSIVPTDRFPVFWNAGYQGNGVKVAIVDADPVNFNNPYLSHAMGGICDPYYWEYDDQYHPTATAGIVAMMGHPDYQGVAPEVTLISADSGTYDPQSRIADASDCAIDAYDSDILNASFGNENAPYDFWTRYFDHVVYHHRRAVVVAAAETGGSGPIGNPDSGYNVITVGGTNDQGDSNWSNDEMYAKSDYTGPGTRDKPEVVAVAQKPDGICTTDIWSASCTPGLEGTSFAAPQVSGLAALLMNKTSVRRWPEVIKSIIMASAVNNVEGASRLSDKDGAGGIDAALAYRIADHGIYGVAPNGWYDYRQISSSSFDGSGYMHYYIPLVKGQKVRAVLNYDSHPDSVDPYNNDQLYSNLDLYVYNPSAQFVTQSMSPVNSFEIVEFIAQQSGTYDIRMRKTSWNTTYEYIGMAWAIESTYLPDLRYIGNWATNIFLRNDGAEPRNVEVHYFNQDGSQAANKDVCGLNPNGVCEIPMSDRFPYGTIASAIVGGSEDVSVMVRQHQSSPDVWAAYTGVQQPSTTVHVPILHKSNWGFFSTIYIQNTATTIASVTVSFKAVVGNNYSKSYSISANGFLPIDLSSITQIGSTFLGSAYITSSQPVAVASTQHHITSGQIDSLMESEYASNAATTVYVPLIQNDNYHWISSIALQNASGSTNNPSVTFYNGILVDNGTECDFPPDVYSVQARFSAFDSDPPGYPHCNKLLSAILSGITLPVAGTTNQSLPGTQQWADYPAIASPSQTVVIPVWYKDGSFTTGITVLNVSGTQQVTVTVRFFSGGDEIVGYRKQQTLNPYQIYNLNTWPSVTFTGSVVVTATRPVAVQVNHVRSGTPSDGIMSHSGVHR